MQEYPKLISIDVVKQALGLTASTHDDVLDRYIGWVSNAIQREAGQPIAQQDITYSFGADECKLWGGWLPLPYYPVSKTVAAIRSRATEFGGEFEDGTAADFEVVRTGSIYLMAARNGFETMRYYEATITVGYPEVPGEIQRVAMEMVVELVKQSDLAGIGKNRFGLSSVAESDSHTGITKTTTLLSKRPEWREVIQQYAVGVTV